MDEETASNQSQESQEPKFTKGEKCIFIHILSTFIIIVIFVIIFSLHVYMVNHTQYGIFDITQRTPVPKGWIELRNQEILRVGYLYLNMTTTRITCNSLLLQPRRSLSTAHCVAMRNEPDMVHLIFAWGLRYKIRSGSKSLIINTGIKKSIVHPLFNRVTFANNIGLIEHTVAVPILANMFRMNNPILGPQLGNIAIVSWNYGIGNTSDDKNNKLSQAGVLQHSRQHCLNALTPVTPIRDNEFCVTLVKGNENIVDYGAILFSYSIPIGLFAWGERNQKELPMVMLNLTVFKQWINL